MRKIKGLVVSEKMNKTRTVFVERLKKHARYLKYYKVGKNFKAHDEKNEYKKGDKVWIQETRPVSKGKRWKIVERIT